MIHNKRLLALALSGLVGIAQAGEKEELLKLRNTTTNLIKQLVKQGVITESAAEQMIKQAEADAETQVAVGKAAAATSEAVPADEVRVAYVPDFVKDEIRQQVRNELKEDVVGDVMAKAKNEQWGIPEALPEWVNRFKLSGDLRLREQMEFNAADNTPGFYKNWVGINASGGETAAQIANLEFLNVNKDRNRMRERLRLAFDVKIADGVDAGIRLATGNVQNPTSTNQTLGNYGMGYQFAVDRAFLKYNVLNDQHFNWLTLTGGRIANPFFTGGSEMVWDEDLSFEGVAATLRHRFGESGSLGDIGAAGPALFLTGGAFPLSESGLSTKDKWLFGGQTGVDWTFSNQDNLTIGVGYFDYRNIRARPNKNASQNFICNSNTADNNFSVPAYMQLGNTLATVCGDNVNADPNNNLIGQVGLASDYKIFNINALYDTALFAPYHLKFGADYAKNVGFNLNDIRSRYGNAFISTGGNADKAQTTAWQIRADLGWPKADRPGNWNVYLQYRYLERDAVLDAFTDSDFHLGMTNVKGWVIGGNYGLMKNVWLTSRWLSADMITGPRYGLDIVQIDINTRF